MKLLLILLCVSAALRETSSAGDRIDIWPDLAPGETTRHIGDTLPPRAQDKPTITRVENISRPTMAYYPASKPNGAAVLILPGGGFGKVVPDLEGSEAATWLNRHGVSAFVLNYRTTPAKAKEPGWPKALQDSQRALALIRSRAEEWGLRENRIGLVAFSAGGQVGARLLCDGGALAYDRIDATDDLSHRPDFAVLIYPWRLYDEEKKALIDGLVVPANCPPTALVHTDDDRSSSLGAVHFYAALKAHAIPAELHVYGNGGHGYGLRPREGSQISSWPGHAAHFLKTQGFISDGTGQESK